MHIVQPIPKPVVWMGDSRKQLKEFPRQVRRMIGFALRTAQKGGKDEKAKPIVGIGSGVLEVVADHQGDTFRAVYTLRVKEVGDRLACLPKEIEERGCYTETRNGFGQTTNETRYGGILKMKHKPEFTVGSGNVFADLGLPNADELLVKADLVIQIKNIIKHRKLTQVKAAKVLGIDQPKVSAMFNGQFSGFSVERLMRFLLLLGRDVEIVVKPIPRSRTQARLKVA